MAMLLQRRLMESALVFLGAFLWAVLLMPLPTQIRGLESLRH